MRNNMKCYIVLIRLNYYYYKNLNYVSIRIS